MSAKIRKFPHPVKVGSAVVKIYREIKGSGTYYRVGYYLGAKRCWLHCATLDGAKIEAEAKAAQLARGDVDAAQLNGKDRLIYGRAVDALRDLNVPLDVAATEYADARKIIGNHSFLEAARFFAKHHSGIASVEVAEAVRLFLNETEEGGSKLYMADLRYRLGAFRDAFHCAVNQITPDDVAKFLAGLGLSRRSKKNFRRALGTFFSFAKRHRLLAKDVDLFEKLKKEKKDIIAIEIFTPAEVGALLEHASADLRPCLAIAAFAGVRAEEILRMEWVDVTRRPGFIEIPADKAKAAARRLIPIKPNLAQWLALTTDQKGFVWKHSKPWFFESMRKAATGGNVTWKQNALRHSFVSYRIAEVGNLHQVANEAGNSERMIHDHYRGLVTPDEAAKWFAITPKRPENIVTIGAAA